MATTVRRRRRKDKPRERFAAGTPESVAAVRTFVRQQRRVRADRERQREVSRRENARREAKRR